MRLVKTLVNILQHTFRHVIGQQFFGSDKCPFMGKSTARPSTSHAGGMPCPWMNEVNILARYPWVRGIFFYQYSLIPSEPEAEKLRFGFMAFAISTELTGDTVRSVLSISYRDC